MNPRITRRFATASVCVAGLAPTALGQNHLLVPSQFPEIGLAVQAAAPGDVIEVTERLPHYQPFVIDRPVTIVGSAGEHRAPTVRVLQGVGIDVQLAPGERATLSRIDVIADATAVATVGIQILGGAVALEDCRFRSGDDLTAQTAVVEVDGAQLTAVFCRFEGGRGGTALRATNSYVAITDTRCFGGTMPAGDGVVVLDCELHATEAWLLGGEDFVAGPGGVALRVAGTSQVTLHQGWASGGNGQPGGSGLVNTTANPVEFSGAGFGGGMNFTTLISAPAAIGPTTMNADLVGLLWNEPPYRRGTLQPGQPWAAWARTNPNVLGMLAFSFGPSGLAALVTRQPALLPQDIALLHPFVTGALGYGGFGATLPNDPTLRGTVLWAQAITGPQFPLEASPPSAVVVR